ncbi:MAG: DUF2791 family P-loop domain-containing protein, partial [Clostridia bacterium]|nr:DUF2791 family P-loop domain-containing protein [Clostridia bacterium]
GVKGCIANGISEAVANKIYDEMMDFAKYAFNKSHAAAYAVVAYQTAYLKYYYPVEFMAALMTSVIDNAGKVAEYIYTCRQMGIKILPPNINEGEGRFSVKDGKICYGLAAIKSVGRPVIEAIVKEREKNGPFKHLKDFIDRLSGKEVNKRTIESFIKAGALDCLGGTRKQFMIIYVKILDQVSQERKYSMTGQMTLFDMVSDEYKKDFDIPLPDVGEYEKETLLAFEKEVSARIYTVLREIETGVGAFDFARVIDSYYRAWKEGDERRQSDCLRWLRGEFTTKTEARAALSVSGIINDDNWYDYIKLIAVFSRKIGYGGLVIFIDECVNLYKIPNRVSRENNYEKILSIFNDTLQGKAEGLEIIFAGTPQFLEDTRRGLFSYEALRSRLVDNMFGKEAVGVSASGQMFGPIMRLARLSDDELLALLARVTVLFKRGYGNVDVKPEEMRDFLYYMLDRAGADTMITPREIIRAYLTALGMLLQDGGRKRLPEMYQKENAFSSVQKAETKTSDFDPEDIEF